MMLHRRWFVLVTASLALSAGGAAAQPEKHRPVVRLGAKPFAESRILANLMARLVESAGVRTDRLKVLAGTQLVFSALEAGEIDAYPEYTGTLREEILSRENLGGDAELRAALAGRGIFMSKPLGFSNSYILGMKETLAKKLHVGTISDLSMHPALRLRFSTEFMNRDDGWPGLRVRYQLPHRDVTGLEHQLAYKGLDTGSIDVTDLYATDAEIQLYQIQPLRDDLGHFPKYEAVILYSQRLADRAPKVVDAIIRLEGRITKDEMLAMNVRAKINKEPESRIAAEFLVEEGFTNVTAPEERSRLQKILRYTRAHMYLVAISLTAAILIAIPLGILAARQPMAAQLILGAVGILQTIPSLALLAFMVPILGIGPVPAMAALFLYSLLPIVRNTFAGLHDIPPQFRESAEALGLPTGARLWKIELPMASRAILAGIKTSAVINVGTATLGGFIAAGGYGEPIITGLQRDDFRQILIEGAIPAAILALAVQGFFELAERRLVPKGLRLKSRS